jgi:hypothetical protein
VNWHSIAIAIAPLVALASGCLGCPPDPAFLPAADCEYGGAGQPAIQLTVAVHYRSFADGDLTQYERVREQVDWLAAWADDHDLRLELALNGYQAEGALAAGEEARYGELFAAGHGFGVHHHPTVRDGELTWLDLPAEPTDEELQRSVDDHRSWIGDALGGIPHDGGHVGLTGRSEWWDGMMRESGYTSETLDAWSHAATGGGSAGVDFDLLHPFRWEVEGAPGTLVHDPDVPFVVIPQHPQLGAIGQGNHLRFDGSLAHLQVLMLLAHLEWRAATQAGEAPRVWTFGITVHPELGATHNGDLERFAEFVRDTFMDPVGGPGRSACAATRDQVLEAYSAWEADLGDGEPFGYTPGDPYPYRLPYLELIYDAHLVELHDDHLDRGIRIAELLEMEDPGEGGVEELVPSDRWLLIWADADDTVDVDVSEWAEGYVEILPTGDPVRSSAVPVGAAPVLIVL